MNETTRSPLKQALIDALIVAVIASLVFGPITGLVLKGYEVQNFLHRPAIMVALAAIGRFIISYASHTEAGQNFLQRLSSKRGAGVTVAEKEQKLWPILVIGLVAGILLPMLLSKYWMTVIIQAMIYVLLGLGLNIVVGLAGLLDLGFVAFYAVGAYGLALGSQYLGLGFWTALPFAMLVAATFGLLLGFPVLRMHGDYLAIVTLGFGEIIRLILNNWLEFTGGPNGAWAPSPTLF